MYAEMEGKAQACHNFTNGEKNHKTFGLARAYTVKPQANFPKLKTLSNINQQPNRQVQCQHRRSEKIPGILSIKSQHKIICLDQNGARDEEHLKDKFCNAIFFYKEKL